MIYLALVLMAFGAVAGPAMRGMMSARTSSDQQGQLQGGLSSVEGLTAIVAPALAAALFAAAVRLGGASWAGTPFLFGAGTYALAAVLLLRLRTEAGPVGIDAVILPPAG